VNDPAVRGVVARNRSTSDATLARLATDANDRVLTGVAERRTLPYIVAEQLAQGRALGRALLAQRPALDERHLDALAADSVDAMRRRMACRPDLPPELVAKLAADQSDQVRAAVAARHDLDVETLTTLAVDGSEHVRVAAAENKGLPRVLIPALAQDVAPEVRRRVAARPGLPRRWVEALGADSCDAVRVAVASRRALAPELLEALCRDVNSDVRLALSANPWAPLDVRAACVDLCDARATADLVQSRHATPALLAQALQPSLDGRGGLPFPQVLQVWHRRGFPIDVMPAQVAQSRHCTVLSRDVESWLQSQLGVLAGATGQPNVFQTMLETWEGTLGELAELVRSLEPPR